MITNCTQQQVHALGTCQIDVLGNVPGADICTPEIHSSLLVEAERAPIAISIKHMHVLLLPTLESARQYPQKQG